MDVFSHPPPPSTTLHPNTFTFLASSPTLQICLLVVGRSLGIKSDLCVTLENVGHIRHLNDILFWLKMLFRNGNESHSLSLLLHLEIIDPHPCYLIFISLIVLFKTLLRLPDRFRTDRSIKGISRFFHTCSSVNSST